MHLLITEDEASVARRLQRLVKQILGAQITSLHLAPSIAATRHYLQHHPVDLLLLDLNLNGADGFKVLQNLVAESFDVIIVSAYGERALEAFEYGVLDFVPKPFSEDRLRQALNRYLGNQSAVSSTLLRIAVKKQGKVYLELVEDLVYIQGADIYTTLHLRPRPNQQEPLRKALCEKTLDSLERLLPDHFARVHRSYIVNMHACQEIIVAGGGKYQLLLDNGQQIPLGRTKYRAVRKKWFS
ncbi:MAG: LytTR family DNA-binding domain-containing protein [Bacteroidota bacterium]